MAAGDPSTDAGDSIETSRVGVAQHQLIDLDLVAQPCDAVDQLGRVRASAPTTAIFMSAIMALRSLS